MVVHAAYHSLETPRTPTSARSGGSQWEGALGRSQRTTCSSHRSRGTSMYRYDRGRPPLANIIRLLATRSCYRTGWKCILGEPISPSKAAKLDLVDRKTQRQESLDKRILSKLAYAGASSSMEICGAWERPPRTRQWLTSRPVLRRRIRSRRPFKLPRHPRLPNDHNSPTRVPLVIVMRGEGFRARRGFVCAPRSCILLKHGSTIGNPR